MRAAFAVGSALVSALLMSAPATAADTKGNGNVPTITRLVKLFLDKEASIDSAARAGDPTALGALLTDDFELRENARAAIPVPRGEWMREILAAPPASGERRGMAVHDFGSVAIASFTQSLPSGAVFIVDVWQASGNDWKLAVRYSSVAQAPSAHRKPAPVPDIPKKY